MRIISKFRDYYDGGSVYGVDKSIVYLRDKTEISLSSTAFGKRSFHCINSALGFCGKIYPLHLEGGLMLWGREAVRKEIIRDYKNQVWKVVDRVEVYYKGYAEKTFLDLENNSVLKNIFFEHKVPTFLVTIGNQHSKLTLNPTLKDFEFYKTFPTVQAFQEIEMFLSNELVTDTMQIPKRTSEEIGTSKGFDNNSFKNSKGNSKKF
jgi:hypothetical protein